MHKRSRKLVSVSVVARISEIFAFNNIVQRQKSELRLKSSLGMPPNSLDLLTSNNKLYALDSRDDGTTAN